jgi:hypothetical protein
LIRTRAAELAEIESFISTRGPTRCPERFAAAVKDALHPIAEMARINAIQIVERGQTYTEQRDIFFARLR